MSAARGSDAVAPRLTCADAVRPDQELTVVWEGQPSPARILRRLPEQSTTNPYPHPDLAQPYRTSELYSVSSSPELSSC